MQWANRRLSGPAFDIWSAGDRPWEGVTFDLARALLNLFREAPHRRAPTRLAPSILRLWNRVTAPKVPEWETFCAQFRLKERFDSRRDPLGSATGGASRMRAYGRLDSLRQTDND
jgi:hypothetical protein